ncbi:YggS family pyridoxal phosphate-dependent enzyme [Holophaga foetida]|uniref:YggS family pyridoxal phosphate-dependent enzyme n=1 Tax=Holophaga foetida TaxID=35839 RepID=UPI0002473ED7|nr:YggS family pyridoxal phosphate-dependent enzyme [Holophaga foetida]
MINIPLRVEILRARIQKACEACNRVPSSVELLPVSKRQPMELIQSASQLGFATFGENYVQEGLAKAQACPDLSFVLIGPLQRNKTKQALLSFTEIMTVDRSELALRLRHLAEELQLSRGIWIQMDLWGEETKMGGCSETALPALIKTLEGDTRLPLQGFLAIPPPGQPEAFQDMAQLRERWQDKLGQRLRLSMGMSDDLEEAVQAGSDQVRIGTALFGERAMSA